MAEPSQFSALTANLTLMLAALNIINMFYTWWRTRNQHVEARFTATAERMDRADARLASLEQTLRTLPAKDDLHQLHLALGELRGDMREIRASMSASVETAKRHDIVLTRVEQFLLERK